MIVKVLVVLTQWDRLRIMYGKTTWKSFGVLVQTALGANVLHTKLTFGQTRAERPIKMISHYFAANPVFMKECGKVVGMSRTIPPSVLF